MGNRSKWFNLAGKCSNPGFAWFLPLAMMRFWAAQGSMMRPPLMAMDWPVI
jgi:hypothetical protein